MKFNRNILISFSRNKIAAVLLLLSFNILIINTESWSQAGLETEIELAKKHYLNKQFDQTISVCEKILSADPKAYVAHWLLAELYKERDSLNLVVHHLSKAGEYSNDTTVYFKLGEVHYEMGNYSEALHAYRKYSSYTFIPEKRQFLLACKMAGCEFAVNSIKKHFGLNIKNNQVNALDFTNEYWPILSSEGNTLIFKRFSNGEGQMVQNNTLIVDIDSASWKQIQENVESGVPNKSGVIPNSEIRFFTAYNRAEGYGNGDIYFSRFENGKWSFPTNAGEKLNSEFWDGQPSFSNKDKQLYFSSSRNGGKGKKDIWRAKLFRFTEDGLPIWGEPKNLGGLINTSGDELSPFFDAEKKSLYFASDSHVGMGGIDLFVAALDNIGSVTNIKNLGHPTNTPEDELGVSVNKIAGTTYFSACRNTLRGLEIFTFNYLRGPGRGDFTYVKAVVADANTKIRIPANIEIVNLFNNNIQNESLGANGEIMLGLMHNKEYRINVTEPGYLFYTEIITPPDHKNINDPYLMNVELKPIEVGAEIELYNIYYETDSYAILPTSEPELNKLVSFLEKNKNIKVEIQGHTDNTGDPQRNMELSLSRAKSVVDFMVKNKIALTRLKYTGFGDTSPIESNETEKGRQLNRRTTVKILDN